MTENNPKTDPKQVLNVIENGAEAVPQTEVLQKPKYKAAQNLLEQLEYFKMSFKLRFNHILWMGLATYICYDRYKAYQQYRDEKQNIFGKNRKTLNEKYGKLNQKYTSSTIHPRGDPDQGDWAYFKELSDSDQKQFLERKISFQDKSSNFNTFMPLYLTSGICFPLTSIFIGLIFRKKVFSEQIQQNQQTQTNNNASPQISQETVNQQNQSNNQNVKEDNLLQNNQTQNTPNTENIKKDTQRFQFFQNFVQNKVTFNMIYGSITGFSILSAIRLLRYFS